MGPNVGCWTFTRAVSSQTPAHGSFTAGRAEPEPGAPLVEGAALAAGEPAASPPPVVAAGLAGADDAVAAWVCDAAGLLASADSPPCPHPTRSGTATAAAVTILSLWLFMVLTFRMDHLRWPTPPPCDVVFAIATPVMQS